MAETRKIVIEILDGNSKEGKKEKGSKITKDADAELKESIDNMIHPFKNTENATIGKVAVLSYGLQQAKQLATQAFTFNIDRKLSLTENYLAQNEYNNFKTTISKAKSLAGTVGSGAITGVQLGGGAVGAVVGAGTWGVGQYIENRANLSSYYQEINTTNYNSQFSRTRAGLVDGGRGTEN